MLAPPLFSLEFKLIVLALWSLVMAAGGFYIEHLRWVDAEAGRPIAVARIIKTITVADQKALKPFRAQVAELNKLNGNLKEELDYARSQIHGSCTFGPAFVSVWDAKLEGRPVGVPQAAGRVPDGTSQARDAVPDDLLTNEARNAVSCAADRKKLDGLREWACRVYKVCP